MTFPKVALNIFFNTFPNFAFEIYSVTQYFHFECSPQTLIMLMKSGSIKHFNPSFIAGTTIYDFAAQISYHDNDFLDLTDFTKNHFYSRVKINGQYFKFDGKI